jgi:molybdenum cofactor cytidylyltransferase
MKFESLAVSAALGAVLAHTTRLPGRTLSKGAVLGAADLADLAAAGHTEVAAAVLESADVEEDAAAARLAAALAADGMAARPPVHGRANLVATRAGLFRADAAAVTALNLVDEAITIATLPDATPVQPGALLVTVKIIPFAVDGAALAAAETLAEAAPPLRLPAFRALQVGLVLTELPGMKPSVFEATEAATRQRVQALSGTLLPARRTPHEAAAIAAALQTLIGEGANLLLVAGASAAVDRWDEAPAALVHAGGTLTRFGMPVDPGNLICLGDINGIPALVLPGCARSPALNGIDLVLRRIFAGEPVAPAEIAAMGVGGLLKDFAPRPAPRAPMAETPPRIAAIILAAGLSSRMAPANKLLLRDAEGVPMVARVADAVLASTAYPVLAVVGHQADAVEAVLAARKVVLVQAPDYAAGLSASLKAGIAALPEDVDATLICLGDMPLITTEDIQAVLGAYSPAEGRLIVVPTNRGKRGNPVLWDRRFFADIAGLSGDSGARSLLLRHAEAVFEVELDGEAVLRDFDTAEAALEGWK